MFLEGFLLLVVAMWLCRKTYHAQSRPQRLVPTSDLEYRLKRAELEYQLATNKLEMTLLDLKERELRSAERRELDRLVLEDALKREERAKAAMVSVMQAQGCDENLIQYVLKTVDNEPE